MEQKPLPRYLLVGGVVLIVLVVLSSFIYLGGNVIPGVGRNVITSHVQHIQDEHLRQQVLKAEHHFRQGKINAAIDILRALTAKYPREDRIFYLLGFYLLAENVFDRDGRVKNALLADEGLDFIKKATEMAPEKINYQLVYAVTLSDLHRDKESVEVFERFFVDTTFRSNPKHRYLVINYADSLVRLGMRARALDEYRKSLAVSDNDERIVAEYARLQTTR